MTNLSTQFEWTKVQVKTENAIAIEHMQSVLSSMVWIEDATKLYAETLIRNIVDVDSKPDKSSKDHECLIKYLKELDRVIGITQKVWYRVVPDDTVQYIDDLSG